VEVVAPLIHLTLTTNPRGGTITIRGERWTLATWHKAGEGQMHATTTDGERVTLAMGEEVSSLTIGNTGSARRWTIREVVKDGAAFTGVALEAPSDAWLEGYIERMAERVRG
jgi:hypothetical protein